MPRPGRRRERPQRQSSPASGAPPPEGAAERLAVWALCAAILGAALLVDPRAEASFDAPKRLVALLGTAVAAAAVFGTSPGSSEPRLRWGALTRLQKATAVLFACGVAGAVLTALLSPRLPQSVAALRPLLVFALLVPLGASRALERGRSGWLLAAFVAGGVVNAVVSLLERAGLVRLFAVESTVARTSTVAFLGNEGLIALSCALAALALAGVAVEAAAPRARALALGGAALLAAGALANRNLTAIAALGAGAVVLLLARSGRRAALPALLLSVVAAGGLAVALKARLPDLGKGERWDDVNIALGDRLIPWVAAVEMARERPLAGWGPGTFEAESVPSLMAAEARGRFRLQAHAPVRHTAQAHSEYLQAAAEVGIPATLELVAAFAAILGSLVSGLLRGERGGRTALLALLVGGAVAAALWFPLQRPATMVPLLLASGRAWRLAAPRGPEEEPR